MAINYIQGDATEPKGEGRKIIVHCCNNRGGWGSGFVVALSRKWRSPELQYRNMGEWPLGAVEIVPVAPDLFVANLIGQHGIGVGDHGMPPIRYEALRQGFQQIIKGERERIRKDTERGYVVQGLASLHMPRLGCALAGGDWALVEPLINATFIAAGMDVTVYDFPGGSPYFDSRNEDSKPVVRDIDEPV